MHILRVTLEKPRTFEPDNDQIYVVIAASEAVSPSNLFCDLVLHDNVTSILYSKFNSGLWLEIKSAVILKGVSVSIQAIFKTPYREAVNVIS